MRNNFIYRQTCELCNSNKKKTLISKAFTDPNIWEFLKEYYEERINKSDLSNGTYEIVKCHQCGFIWQTYILNEEFMEKLYSVWTSVERSLAKKQYADISLYSRYAREAECINLLIKKKPLEIDVLDFGMGWGFWCLMAKAFGYNVVGYEISRERIMFAKRNGIDVIEDISGNNKYDFINAEQVFEHIPNPLQTLKILVSNLKEGGVIYISVPNGIGIEKELGSPEWKPSKNEIHPLEHINCFTNHSLKELGKIAGLYSINHPFILSKRNSLKEIFKCVGRKYYQKYFGTSLYFKQTIQI